MTPLSSSLEASDKRPMTGDWSPTEPLHRAVLERSASEELLSLSARAQLRSFVESRRDQVAERASEPPFAPSSNPSIRLDRSHSPPPLSNNDAVNRAISLSKKLSGSNIPTQVTDSGDLMLDMTGYKSSEEEALRAEVIARKILSEELEGNYDIGALIGADEHGNLWIYSSEEAKEAAVRKAGFNDLAPETVLSDTASDPGYHSDEERRPDSAQSSEQHRGLQPSLPPTGLVTPPQTPPNIASAGDPNRNYAKTLRLTSEQLKALNLKPGPNTLSFSVNRATCQANMYYWSYNVPVVISDIDGTITK